MLILSAALVVCSAVHAQIILARASSVTGRVLLTNGNGTSALAGGTGYQLAPGDRLDTRGGGQIVIELTDGSMIVVQPESVIVIKDFRSAASLRELFEIMLGSVRVKINHFGGRPNPYRINSPTASIAVRGTDFSVTVDTRGDTQVMVYEGAVEVTSLIDPTQSVVIEAGRGVLLVPGQGFQLFNVLSGRELAENQGNGRGQGTSAAGQTDDRDWDSPRNIASTYEQYIAGLSEIGQLPFLQRYNAFPEAHLDSLENPAYAADLRTAEGRVVLLPSLNGTGGLDENPTPPGLSAVSPLNYSAASQVSMFVPLAGFVIGGNVTGSKVGSGVQGAPSDLGLSSILSQTVPEGSLQTSASSTGEFFSSSVLVARRFGGTGFGLAIEDLQGAGSFAAQILSTETLSGSIERIDSTSAISQRRFTAGFERDLPHNQVFGFYYRYGLIAASENDTTHVLNNSSEPLDATRSSGHSSEFGLRLRGPLGRRFLYGVQASWNGLSVSDGLTRAITTASHQRDRAQRSSAALGLGYFLNPRTVLSFDIAGGTSPAATNRTEIGTGDLVQTGLQNSRFISTNVGVQHKVSSKLFLNASLLGIWQAYNLSQTVYPSSTGNSLLITDPFLPMTATGYRPPRVSSDFGAGWRFSNRLLVQYVFSTSYGVDSGTHTLMLRYTFHLGGE